MALADPIFTLDGWVQFFWAAFDLPVTMVPLKVALGLKNWIYSYLKKIIEKDHLTATLSIIFFR